MFRNLRLLAAVLLLGMVTLVLAAAPADNGNKGAYSVYTSDVAVFTNDTLLAATTIDTLLGAFYPQANFDYIACFKTFTGTGADSVEMIVSIEGLDPNGVRLSRVVVDTVTDSAGEQAILPFGSLIVGSSYRVICQGGAKQGGVVVPTDTVYIYRRRVFNYTSK